jgi:uncharacterized protein
MERSQGALSQAECWQLLAMASVGRLALSIRALPTILPVRYEIDDASVAISLGRLGMPAAAVHDSVVAFAVDRIDEETAQGWIVQMQGRARLALPGSASEGGGPVDSGQVVRLVPGTVTGHRFTLDAGTPVR